MSLLPYIRDRKALLAKRSGSTASRDVAATVDDILGQIRSGGDDAVRALTAKLDDVATDNFRVPAEVFSDSATALDADLRHAFKAAAENIRRFHEQQLPRAYNMTQPDSTRVRWRWRPINRVGIYVPGGRYPLASSLLMSVVAARAAGVRDLAVCTPPQVDGLPDKVILGLCGILKVTEVYAIGGAQAVGAMAFGTASIEAVDKIVGPGNAYVAEAKRQVSQFVGIDMPAGPTEIAVLADESATAQSVAADLISQAEHDPLAIATLVTAHQPFAKAVNGSLEELLKDLPTESVARASLQNFGAIYIGGDLEDCLATVNALAPEHLSLQVRDAANLVDRCVAGAIFIGNSTPVAWGDYWAGPNHTLPTSGMARSRGPLSVLDFLVPYSVIEATPETIAMSADSVMAMAKSEGLSGHALSIEERITRG